MTFTKIVRPMQLVHNFIRQRGILKILNGTHYNFIWILLLLYSINISHNGCNCWTHNGSLLNWDETWNDSCTHNLPSFTFPFFCINNVSISKMSSFFVNCYCVYVTGYYNFLVSLVLEEGVKQFLIFECVASLVFAPTDIVIEINILPP